MKLEVLYKEQKNEGEFIPIAITLETFEEFHGLQICMQNRSSSSATSLERQAIRDMWRILDRNLGSFYLLRDGMGNGGMYNMEKVKAGLFPDYNIY